MTTFYQVSLLEIAANNLSFSAPELQLQPGNNFVHSPIFIHSEELEDLEKKSNSSLIIDINMRIKQGCIISIGC